MLYSQKRHWNKYSGIILHYPQNTWLLPMAFIATVIKKKKINFLRLIFFLTMNFNMVEGSRFMVQGSWLMVESLSLPLPSLPLAFAFCLLPLYGKIPNSA